MELKVYVSSRASIPARPALWNRLKELGWPIISTWHECQNVQPGVDMRDLWRTIEREIALCTHLVLYVEPNDLPLKRAYVEAGMALAYGKPVYVVYNTNGNVASPEVMRQHLGSWISHPNVMVCDHLESARFCIMKGIDNVAFQAARSRADSAS